MTIDQVTTGGLLPRKSVESVGEEKRVRPRFCTKHVLSGAFLVVIPKIWIVGRLDPCGIEERRRVDRRLHR
jgi:hypothetical protein